MQENDAEAGEMGERFSRQKLQRLVQFPCPRMSATSKQILEGARTLHVAMQDDIAQSRTRLDHWMANQAAVLEKATSEHRVALQRQDETVQSLKAKDKTLRSEVAKTQKDVEERKMELDSASRSLQLVKEKENLTPKVLDTLSQTLKRELDCLKEVKQEKEKRYKMEELAKGTRFYSDRLALRFERFDGAEDYLRFTFTNIAEKDPSREFYFSISVEGGLYKVIECHPQVASAPVLVKQLNESNNLTIFVRAMRHAFKALA